MLLNKGPVPNSMGLNPQSTQQFGQTAKNFATNPSTWAKGLRRFGLPLSLLLNANEAQAAELPGFQEKLQQGLLTMPHEQQQATPQEHEMRDARQSLGANFTEQEVARAMLKNEPFENDPYYGDSDDGGYAGHPGTPGFGEPGYGGSSSSGRGYGGSSSSGSGHNGRMTWRDIMNIQDPVRQKELLDQYNAGASNTNRANHHTFDYN